MTADRTPQGTGAPDVTSAPDGADAGWRCAGPRWRSAAEPALLWRHPAHGERASPLSTGRLIAFTTRAERGCLGVRRGDRHTPCPVAAPISPSAVSAQCPDCARLDRSYSVAADTRTDDRRPYDVYLAWFGPGWIKVGITATEREGARLLEQAALSYVLLARGPLMAARRAEAVLGAALAVPDRFPYAAKRAARQHPTRREDRAAELTALHARAHELAALPESLRPLTCAPVHHDAAFGLDRIGPSAPHGLVLLGSHCTVAGHVAAVAGPDVYLCGTDGRPLLLDARHLAGWPLVAADPAAMTTARIRPAPGTPQEPAALF
ncbi:DUF2797 domain-containing protein [Streptomyces zagrosensis]|uniref:DUF2797 domain-containing protein n=1 Tax=Streptomyces zagrosensis TaxID=1042984 RepID=A0A7W9UXY9_9ACTN|nr:DUF2797 domain-containing protein [Streptomyces zagrosensis]MBB5935388.1 hypothetical protein [Streptomyces zagrosensis]